MKIKPILSGGSSGPLFPYFNLYLTQIKKQGYAVGSHYEQVHVLKVCDRWLKRTGREVSDLDESVVCECLRRVIKGGYGKNAGVSTLRRLLAMLRRIGVTPEAKPVRPSPSEQMTRAYERFLLDERNLVPQTVAHRRLTASRFLSEKFGGLYRLGYHSKATGHGFRATASTILNENGFQPSIIERQLAHAERNEVRAAYNHAEYLPERRKMMQWWADYLGEVAKKH